MKINHLLLVFLSFFAAAATAQTVNTTTSMDSTVEKNQKHIPDSIRKDSRRYDVRWAMLDLGINTYLYSGAFNLPQSLDAYELNIGRSYHVNFRLFEQRIKLDRKGYVSLSEGLNFEWQYYNFVNDYEFEPRKPVVTPVLSEKRFSKNRLLAHIISLPLELNFESNPRRHSQSFHLSAGLKGSFLYSANQRTKLEDNGDRNKVRDDFNLNKFRLGWIGRIGYGPVSFYVAQAITPLFKDGEGPKLIPIQIGINVVPY